MKKEDPFTISPPVKKRRLNVLPENPDQSTSEVVGLGRFPKWLHRKMPTGDTLWETGKVLGEQRLPTVCEEAKCPNLLECWSQKTATFLAMGSACTRNCGFCDIDFAATPKPLEPDEPDRIAESVKELDLKHVVITMVARDDLKDGGAGQLARIIERIREVNAGVSIEVLTSDFEGSSVALGMIFESGPEIFNHNIETVRRLTDRVRHKATYDRTLSILKQAKTSAKCHFVKSGLMVGLGESNKEIEETISDLYEAGCDIITIGHYLQPNSRKLRVKRFITPDDFQHFADFGKNIGVPFMYSAPFVRSSYNAKEVFNTLSMRESR